MTDEARTPALGSEAFMFAMLSDLRGALADELADLRRYRPVGRSLALRVAELLNFRPQRTPARAYADDALPLAAGDWLQYAAGAVEVAAIRRVGRIDVTDDEITAAFEEAIACSNHASWFQYLPAAEALDLPAPDRVPSSPRVAIAMASLIGELDPTDPLNRSQAEPSWKRFAEVAGHALACVYVLLVQDAAQQDPEFAAGFRTAVVAPPSPPPERDLLIGSASHSLIFAPRAAAEEIRATRRALATCVTWGDAVARLSRDRLGDLHDWLFGGRDANRTPSETPLDLSVLHERGAWPRLYYSDIPSYLPEQFLAEYGKSFATMMDCGVIFEHNTEDELIGRLDMLGVRCARDADLDELFISSEVY
jgi:hypothetical protein